MTSPIDLNYPADLDEQIEAALEALRAQYLDPTAPPSDAQKLGIAMSILSQLLTKISPAGVELAESGILMQAVALKAVIYHISNTTPGEWFHETTTDIKRALMAIELLVVIAKAEEAKAAPAAEAPAHAAAPAAG